VVTIRDDDKPEKHSATIWGRLTCYYDDRTTFKRICDGPLTLFETLDDVKNFISPDYIIIHEIWECEYRASIHHSLWYFSDYDRKPYWLQKTCFSKLPDGTIFADNLTLLKQVDLT